MQRRVQQLATVLWICFASARALAHGGPPDAYAVLSHDSEGPRAVSLSAGLALRRSAQRYQFVCPAAWGDQFAAPASALPDGTIVIGAASGLMLLDAEGTVRPHPDPAATGRSSDVVRSARGIFALRTTAEGSEVLAVDAASVRVLWKDKNSLFSLAIWDDQLVLLHGGGMNIEQITLATSDGAELERQTAVLDFPLDNVFARANAGGAYALVLFRHGSIALGSLQMNSFTTLAEGRQSIAGPLSIGDATLVALDGQLAQLAGTQTTPLADDHTVVCLTEDDGLVYACDREGITSVLGQSLDQPLFRFSWLMAPNLEQVPMGEARMRCNAQWYDLRSDLQLTGISLLADSMPAVGLAGSMPAAGSGAGAASVPSSGAGADPMVAASMTAAGAEAQDDGTETVAPAVQQPPAGNGCAVLPSRKPAGAAWARAVGLLLAAVFVRRRGSSRAWTI